MTVTIRRVARRDRFVIVDIRAVDDASLSWAARGLLVYLLARPDDWMVLVNQLAKCGNLRRDGIYTLLRELRNAGYVRYLRKRDAQGRMRGGEYLISEVSLRRPDSPDTASPDMDRPGPVQAGALLKTEIYKRTTTTTTPTETNHGAKNSASHSRLDFPACVPAKHHRSAGVLLSSLSRDDAKLVINVWAQALAAGKIDRSPLGYLRTLTNRHKLGEMSTPNSDIAPD